LPQRSQKILLGNIDTGVAQDVVRRDVKKELRNAERQQQRFAGECSLGTVLEVKATSLSAASSIFACDNDRMPVGFRC